MKISDGNYELCVHITQELQKFPDENLSVKEIQQFLDIVNYIKDFIPNCLSYTNKPSKLLLKNPPTWGKNQTLALAHLKAVCKDPLPLWILGKDKRILQTNVSDDYSGVFVLEDVAGNIYYCAHASNQFKDSRCHYHAVY